MIQFLSVQMMPKPKLVLGTLPQAEINMGESDAIIRFTNLHGPFGLGPNELLGQNIASSEIYLLIRQSLSALGPN